MSYFGVKGKGLIGYISNLPKLRKTIKTNDPLVIHAHYSFCGIVSALATRKPIVCSLMGSDVKSSGLWRIIIRYYVKHIWTTTIVKSEDMKKSLGVNTNKIHVIPNGVDLEVFKPLGKALCRKKVGWEKNKTIVLFASNPARQEKNFELARQSFIKLGLQDAELKVIFNVKHEEMPYYLCASDLLLSTSKWEGSPNIIKEAMACNLPIVSTDVGDVEWLLDGVSNCFVTSNDPGDISNKLDLTLQLEGQTNGRQRLFELGLDSESIADEIIELYKQILVTVQK